MKRITISIPDDLKKKLDSRPDVNWSEILKKGLQKKLEQLEKLQMRGDL